MRRIRTRVLTSVYLKTSAKHLLCLSSLSALVVALRLFNVLVSLCCGTLKEDRTRSVGPSLKKKKKKKTTTAILLKSIFWFAIHFTKNLSITPVHSRVTFDGTWGFRFDRCTEHSAEGSKTRSCRIVPYYVFFSSDPAVRFPIFVGDK